MVKTIYWDNGRVMILDQVKLPHEVAYITCTDHHRVARCIREMNIRGAPAIGIATAMGVALGAARIAASSYAEFTSRLAGVYEDFLLTRPTAVNIRWAVDRLKVFLGERKHLLVVQLKEALINEAIAILQEDVEINRSIGRYGAKFIVNGARVLTHCNAGSLATGGYGTATAPMYMAKEEGRDFMVFAGETRPLLQGARLTAWELKEAGVPVTLITDSSAGALMRRGQIDLAIVGTDRTARNGDVCNKIGTYTVAVMCREHGIPFYVAAPMSSIDFSMASGDEIPIEERSPDEVTCVSGICKIAPDGIEVMNMAFDVTPSKYVTAIITEKGAFRPADLYRLAEPDADLESLRI